MKKKEFLNKLYDVLCESITEKEAMYHINYYKSYIDEQVESGRKEKDVIEDLGNPRLIAKTLIESGTYQNNSYSNSSSDKYDYQDSSYSNDNGDSKKRKGLVSLILANLTWKQKIKLFLILALVILCIAIPFIYAIGMVITFVKIVFAFLVKFIVPIAIIVGGYYIYKIIKS